MTTEITTRDDTYAARYEAADPYAQFANEGGPGIQGKLLTCKKGVWGIGQDCTPPPVGARYLFIADTMMRGWLKWVGGVIVAADMGLVVDNFRVKHRDALGDLEEEEWEKTPDAKPRDPWSKAYRALLIELSPPHGELTFSGSSYGTELGLKELSGMYAAARSQHPDTYPVVELATAPWTSKHYGKQVRPDFPIVGWATVEDVKAGRKAQATLTKSKRKAKAPPLAADNDERPADWGSAAA